MLFQRITSILWIPFKTTTCIFEKKTQQNVTNKKQLNHSLIKSKYNFTTWLLSVEYLSNPILTFPTLHQYLTDFFFHLDKDFSKIIMVCHVLLIISQLMTGKYDSVFLSYLEITISMCEYIYKIFAKISIKLIK